MTDDADDAPKGSPVPCDDAVAELYRYLDDELSDSERHAIEDHLRECSPCLEAFDVEADLKRVVAAGARQPCPEALKAKLRELLSGPTEPA